MNDEVLALINDLGLVPGPIPVSFIEACRKPKFCDIVKRYQESRLNEQRQLCKELYLRNRKFSRYVCRSYHNKA